MTPGALFRTFAIAEAITWAGLIGALVLRWSGLTDDAVGVAGGLHGLVFLGYCASTVFVWVNQRWSIRTGVLGLVLAVIPFATVPYEIFLGRARRLDGDWRLRPGGDSPANFFERTQAWVLRSPAIAISLIAIAVVIVFGVLLWLGPPVPRA